MQNEQHLRCAQHSDEIKEIKHTLFGNGRPGLKDRVTIIETKMETHGKLLMTIIVISMPPLIQALLNFLPHAAK